MRIRVILVEGDFLEIEVHAPDKNTHVLIDEGDVFLNKYLFSIDGENEVDGLVKVGSRTVYLFTATLSAYFEDLARDVFACDLDNRQRFVPLNTLLQRDTEENCVRYDGSWY